MKYDLGKKAKKTLQEFVPVIDKRIAEYFDKEIALEFGFNQRQKEVVRRALEHGKEYILRPTKRLRASFVNYGYMLGGEDVNEKVWQAAVGIELVHAALLMHDDIQDGDITRRRGPATHKYYGDILNNSHLGEAMGINIGDALLCMGFEAIGASNNRRALNQVFRGIINTGWGQSYDVTLEALHKWTEEDVIVLHQAKTAIYTYENPLFVGGRLAGLPEKAFEILHEYAMDGGVAFQLQDDILGVYGDPEKTGKSADSDLKQGKCTLLILKVLESGTEAQRRKVNKVWGKFEKVTRKELDDAKEAIKESGSYEYSKQLAIKYAMKAAASVGKLRKLNLNSQAVDYIQGIAEYMVDREV